MVVGKKESCLGLFDMNFEQRKIRVKCKNLNRRWFHNLGTPEINKRHNGKLLGFCNWTVNGCIYYYSMVEVKRKFLLTKTMEILIWEEQLDNEQGEEICNEGYVPKSFIAIFGGNSRLRLGITWETYSTITPQNDIF